MKRFILIFKMLLNVCYILVVHLCVVEVFATKRLGSFNWHSKNRETSCEFEVPTPTTSHHVPIFLDRINHLELSNKIKLNNGERLLLACSGVNNNYLEQSHFAITEAVCLGGFQLNVAGQTVLVQNLRCNKEIKSTIKPTSEIGEYCPFKSYWIGYDVKHDRYIKKIFVCYDDFRHSPVYARHEVYGLDSKSSRNRLKFKSDYTGLSGSTLEKIYKSISDIQKGHLSPHADFSTVYGQQTTYYYVNVFPQWGYINNGDWKSLESAVRRRSSRGKLIVYTGTYGSRRSIDQVPIPQFVWKAVYNENITKGIVFINLNIQRNESSIPINHYPCTTLSKCTSWGRNSWSTIVCCTVQNLHSNIKRYIPSVNSVLDG